jgi:NTE family protein
MHMMGLLSKLTRRSQLYRIWFLIFFVLLGCQTKYEVCENPPPIPLCMPCEKVRVAVVLGGGGARGLAHVGVLEELEKAGISIDVIIGCSAGSIVGALYADCPNAAYVRQLLQPLRKWDVLDINILKARYGLVQGHSLRRFLRKNLKARCFEDLQIPLYVVATDLYSGDLVCIGSGPIIPAVHASSAVPFVFAPVLHYGRVLVDGGVVDPVPVAIAKQLGAQLIIAIDLCELLPKTCPTNLFGVATKCAEIKFAKQSESCVQGANIVIRPELKEVGMFDDDHHDLVYRAGCEACRNALPNILEAIYLCCQETETNDAQVEENDLCYQEEN